MGTTTEARRRTDDPRVYRMMKRREDLYCSFCRPHRGENQRRHTAHGPRKPRAKQRQR